MQYNQGMTNPYLQQQQESFYPQAFQNQPMYGTAYQNAVPIGGVGYNGGYNFGYGYGYVSYDPLEIRRMQEEEQERRQREYNNSINIRKRLMKSTDYYFNDGVVNDDYDYLDEYYSYENMQKIYNIQMQDMNMERLSNLNQIQQMQREEYSKQLIEIASNEAANVKNESLVQFLEGTATDRYMELVVNAKYNSQTRNIGRLYNHESFAELVSMHNRDNNTNPIFNPMITVDDLEISLPQKLKSEYEERRAQFIKSIVDSNPVRL